MRITDISESNSSTILRWAITNNANFKKNLGLADIISDDMHYILTLEDVNFLELYKFSQRLFKELTLKVINFLKLQKSQLKNF